MRAKKEAQQECLRLRLEERKSLGEIVRLVGVSKASVSVWLRDCPLTKEEKELRRHVLVVQHRPEPEPSLTYRLAKENKLNGLQVAKVAEATALLRLLVRGINVFGSVFDGDRTDWVVELPETGKTYKVQVKTTYTGKHGRPIVGLRRGGYKNNKGTRYTAQEVDFLVGFDLLTDTCYVWAWEELAGNSTTVSTCEEAKERWDKVRAHA